VDGYDVIVVGSGAGGATVARELSRRGRRVLVLERGPDLRMAGGLWQAFRCFDRPKFWPLPRKSGEGVIIWRTLVAGGTTVAACGNAVRCLEAELAALGIHLGEEFAEAEREMGVAPTPPSLLGDGSRRIQQAAGALGYGMEPMPKSLAACRCIACGRCVLGCRPGAKWTALDYLAEARESGAEIRCNAAVCRVTSENGRATGVVCRGPEGEEEVRANLVVLAAGGLGTPPILQRSGIAAAGQGLFADLFVNTYAVVPGADQASEPVMALVDGEFRDTDGFILSPFVNGPRLVRFMEAGLRGLRLPRRGLMGIMTKIADEAVGRVDGDGRFSKPVTERDRARLQRGAAMAQEILVAAGADSRSALVTPPQGAHPGGTAAIGKVVGADLQTEMAGLYVCDASVLPQSPGLPPILTIVALAKRLGRSLTA